MDTVNAKWIKQLIEEDKLYKFYKSRQWLDVKEKMLKMHHYECQWCKKKGKITKAVTVHHVQHVKKYPELALSEYYIYKGRQQQNLIPLCHDCHDRSHNRMQYKPKPKPLNEERW